MRYDVTRISTCQESLHYYKYLICWYPSMKKEPTTFIQPIRTEKSSHSVDWYHRVHHAGHGPEKQKREMSEEIRNKIPEKYVKGDDFKIISTQLDVLVTIYANIIKMLKVH